MIDDAEDVMATEEAADRGIPTGRRHPGPGYVQAQGPGRELQAGGSGLAGAGGAGGQLLL
jgi:hypothetical protein